LNLISITYARQHPRDVVEPRKRGAQ